MPNPALQPHNRVTKSPQRPIPAPSYNQNHSPALRIPASVQKKKRSYRWVWLLSAMVVCMLFCVIGAFSLGIMFVYSNGILPAISVSGIELGGLSEQEATAKLNSEWDTLVLRDGDRTWPINPATLGIILDAEATAKNAYDIGRTSGNPINALIGKLEVKPVVSINPDTATVEFGRIAEQINIPPIDASVGFENDRVIAVPSINGRAIDLYETVQRLPQLVQTASKSGEIELVMVEIAPYVTDVAPIIAQAEALLSRPLEIRVFDPVTGDTVIWSLPSNEWGQWLKVTPDESRAIGLALNANPDAVRDFLVRHASNVLDSTRTLDLESGVQSIVEAIKSGDPSAGYVQVKHQERVHTVQVGESITSIAWDYGIPYLYIQNLNNGIESVSVGQQIKIPSADIFLSRSVNPAKRIVVSISNQNVKVYENNQLKWDWVASTGISDSPTWTGIYQIQSHVDNAYAANWNLHMPNFMGVYQPVPGADFTNGFHGFPTRGGGQLLWENSLGRKVTYGCILLSNTNIQQLYHWAEEGVVVEIRA